jgi:hypothetical protein
VSIVSRLPFLVNGDEGVYLFVFLDITKVYYGEDGSLMMNFTDSTAIKYFKAVFASVVNDSQTLRKEAVVQWLLELQEQI